MSFFAPNLSRAGRLARLIWGIALVGIAFTQYHRSRWLCFLLAAAGAFAWFEAARGWCILRACGIKTRM